MTVTTADDLRANLIGAWTLQSYASTYVDGSDMVYPLGVDARGIIMYTRAHELCRHVAVRGSTTPAPLSEAAEAAHNNFLLGCD